MIPWWLYLVGGLALTSVGAYGGYQVTAWSKDEQINKLKIQHQSEVIASQNAARLDQINRDRITHDADVIAAKAQQEANDRANLLPQRIPVYVTRKSDTGCILPNGFAKLLDGYALGIEPDALPGAASEPNDAPSGLSLSQASALLATNLGTLKLARDKLKEWNEWAAKQGAANH